MRNLITLMAAGLLAFILLEGCGTEPSKDEISASVDAQVSEATLKDTPALSDTDKHAPTKASIPFNTSSNLTGPPDSPTSTNLSIFRPARAILV